MDGAIWYAIYKNGREIEEDVSLSRKGLLDLEKRKIKKFGLKSKKWRASFDISGSFFFNGRKINSALPDEKIKDFALVCYNKMVLGDLASDASREVYLVFGYRVDNGESILVVEPNFPAYCFLRKTNSQGKWYYAMNDKLINQKQYNFILNF